MRWMVEHTTHMSKASWSRCLEKERERDIYIWRLSIIYRHVHSWRQPWKTCYNQKTAIAGTNVWMCRLVQANRPKFIYCPMSRRFREIPWNFARVLYAAAEPLTIFTSFSDICVFVFFGILGSYIHIFGEKKTTHSLTVRQGNIKHVQKFRVYSLKNGVDIGTFVR